MRKDSRKPFDLAFGDFFFFFLVCCSSVPASSWFSCCSSSSAVFLFFLFFSGSSFSHPLFFSWVFASSAGGAIFLGLGSSISSDSDCFSNRWLFVLETLSWAVISAFTLATSELGNRRSRFTGAGGVSETGVSAFFPLPFALAAIATAKAFPLPRGRNQESWWGYKTNDSKIQTSSTPVVQIQPNRTSCMCWLS